MFLNRLYQVGGETPRSVGVSPGREAFLHRYSAFASCHSATNPRWLAKIVDSTSFVRLDYTHRGIPAPEQPAVASAVKFNWILSVMRRHHAKARRWPSAQGIASSSQWSASQYQAGAVGGVGVHRRSSGLP